VTRLLIDMGNSRLKWCLQQQGRIHAQHSLDYPADLAAFDTLLHHTWHTTEPPDQVWLATVAAADKVDYLIQWIQQSWQLTPKQVSTTRKACGVYNAYLQAEQLGVDRWLAMIAAHHLVQTEVCVVDCGTALTLDVVTASGQHQGGLIMPGLNTMRYSLAKHTHALAELMQMRLQHTEPALLATDTRMGIQVGTVYAVVGFIETVMTRLAQRDKITTLILTGGDAETLIPFLQHPFEHIPNLVLQGLGILAKNHN